MTETRFDRGAAALALEQWVKQGCSGSPLLYGRSDFWPTSRWSNLSPGLWLKREDELSFTLSGPKYRKFCGMAAAFDAHDSILAVGSARSAFLLGLAQLCRETQMPLELILLRSTPYQDFGTDVLYDIAFADLPVHWLTREQWPEAKAMALELAAARSRRESDDNAPRGPGTGETGRSPSPMEPALRQRSLGPLVLAEGGAGPEALAGALTLPLDIAEQMTRLQIAPEEIWIDAGSGFTAQALILGLGTLLRHPPTVHVVLCAGDDQSFAQDLSLRQGEARAALGIAWQPASYRTHRPSTARAYGATNRQVWDKVAQFHRQKGILLDPLYTAKLMLTFEAFRAAHPASTPKSTLLIHSGGGLNNFGFRDGLRGTARDEAR